MDQLVCSLICNDPLPVKQPDRADPQVLLHRIIRVGVASFGTCSISIGADRLDLRQAMFIE